MPAVDDNTGMGSRQAPVTTAETDPQLDDIALLAAQICAAPVALLGVLENDDQVPRATLGIHAKTTPLNELICQHTIDTGGLLVISDLAEDRRTKTHALVTAKPSLRFYAGMMLADKSGTPLGSLCVMDYEPRPGGLTTEQEAGLKALARQAMTLLSVESERSRARTVFDSAIDYAIIVMDLDGTVVDWSEGAQRILGWDRDEMIGRDVDAFFTPEDREAGISDKEMQSAREKGRGMDERWHLRKSGERFWASGEMMPLRQPSGKLEGYVKMLRDRTKERVAEERLEMALASSGAVGLWDWMVDSDLLHGDANFARLYGLDIDETKAGLTEEQYQRYVVADDLEALRRDIREVFEAGADFLVEYRLDIPDLPLRWVECKGRMLYSADGQPVRFSGTAVDITARKLAEEQRHLLMQELSHRVKNTFAVVQAIVFQTLRGIDQKVIDALQSRLAALSRAHEILVQTSWSSTSIDELLDRVLRFEGDESRFVFDGPDLVIGSRAALSLSMLLHELATNAVKHGSLSVSVGKVFLSWKLREETFCLEWKETGGPPAINSESKGFGSKLIAMGIAGTREVDLDYAPEGLTARFECPRETLEFDQG
ncbi:PAS domain S-box protein [Qipengyuania sp. GH25]|uniref:histidine kinase n=1 Tax=Qipengyuania pacifica TaxID=2860199 RepID=A0ABS7JHT0_9SPHN|nr:PAS domain S-box protein [Qipengyuania aerophila]MBX7489580.1 PAS domain S-box protein [Qipengyuania aerophila]